MLKGMMEEAKKRESKDNYDIMKEHGYHKVSNTKYRKIIKKAFEKIGIVVYGNGYDLIDDNTKRWIETGELDENIDKVILYELKTTNRKDIGSDFDGFSYGISINEIRNATSLGTNYKLIYLNFRTGQIKVHAFDPPITGIIGYQCVEGKNKNTQKISEEHKNVMTFLTS